MKKFFVVLAVLFVVGSGCLHAQHIKKDMNLVNVGLGMLPGIGLNVSFDHGLIDTWGAGIFTVGGYVGFGSWSEAYHIPGYKNYRVSTFAFAPRATYRYAIDPLFEIYGVAMLGVSVRTYSEYKGNANSGFFAVNAGGRYLFSTNASLFAEFGFNEISFLNVGLCLSF
jgi:hypothetical protein